MPDSLLFDGTDDAIAVSIGDCGFAGGDLTMAMIVKQTADVSTVRYALYIGQSTSGGDRHAIYHTTGGIVGLQLGNNLRPAPTATFRHSQAWTLVAISRAAGTTTPRFHTYDWNTTTWLHENGGSTVADGTAPTVSSIIGRYANAGATCWNGNILIAGVWNANLSDPAIESLITGKPAWEIANPADAWRLDRLSTISSFSGSSVETSRVGTTLDAGDAPAGWIDFTPRHPAHDHANPAVF